MDEREKIMYKRLEPKAHENAKVILSILKSIKDECKKNICCETCKYCRESERYYNPCAFSGDDNDPKDWNEYDLTERIFK